MIKYFFLYFKYNFLLCTCTSSTFFGEYFYFYLSSFFPCYLYFYSSTKKLYLYQHWGYVTTKLHGKSTCRCHNNTIFSDSYFQVSCRLRMPVTLIWLWRSLGSSCQTGRMAALLNSLFFLFKISFLPKYRVIYYDYIVKWCSGI